MTKINLSFPIIYIKSYDNHKKPIDVNSPLSLTLTDRHEIHLRIHGLSKWRDRDGMSGCRHHKSRFHAPARCQDPSEIERYTRYCHEIDSFRSRTRKDGSAAVSPEGHVPAGREEPRTIPEIFFRKSISKISLRFWHIWKRFPCRKSGRISAQIFRPNWIKMVSWTRPASYIFFIGKENLLAWNTSRTEWKIK